MIVAGPSSDPGPSSSSVAAVFPDSDSLESLDIPALVSFLRTSFQRSDFDRVEKILLWREESIRAEAGRTFADDLTMKEIKMMDLEARCEAAEAEAAGLRGRATEAEEKARKAEEFPRALYAKYKKRMSAAKESKAHMEARYAELESARSAVAEELVVCKGMLRKLEGKIVSVEEEWEAGRRREEKLQRKILELYEVIRKKDGDLEMMKQISLKNMDLEEARRRAEAEVEELKRRYVDLEVRGLQFLEENQNLKDRLMGEGSTEPVEAMIDESSKQDAMQLLMQSKGVCENMADCAVAAQSGLQSASGGLIEITDSEDDEDEMCL